MGSTNLAALQATTNRFAAFAGFSPIAADGGMGPQTINAVSKALSFVGNFGIANALVGAVTGIGGPSEGTKGVALGFADMLKSGDPATTIMQRNVDMNLVLTTAAAEMGIKAASAPTAPIVGGGGGGGIFVNPNTGNAQLPTPPATQGFIAGLALKLGMSTTQVVLFMAMAGGIGVIAYKRATGKRGR